MATALFDNIISSFSNQIEEKDLNGEKGKIKNGEKKGEVKEELEDESEDMVPQKAKSKHKKSKTFTINVKDFLHQYDCYICLDCVVEPVTLPCGHTFCKSCILESRKKDDKRECGVCRSRYRGDLGINISLDQTLKLVGGLTYQKSVDKRVYMMKQAAILEEFHDTGHFSVLHQKVRRYLKENISCSYQDVIKSFEFSYPELEIKYLLHKFVNDKEIIIYDNQIIYKKKLTNFLQQRVNNIKSHHLVMFMLQTIPTRRSEYDSEDEYSTVRATVANKYQKYFDCTLSTFLKKIHFSELKIITNMIENILFINEQICENCGTVHDLYKNGDEDTHEESHEESHESDEADQNSEEYEYSSQYEPEFESD